jgi:hypothetical protein
MLLFASNPHNSSDCKILLKHNLCFDFYKFYVDKTEKDTFPITKQRFPDWTHRFLLRGKTHPPYLKAIQSENTEQIALWEQYYDEIIDFLSSVMDEQFNELFAKSRQLKNVFIDRSYKYCNFTLPELIHIYELNLKLESGWTEIEPCLGLDDINQKWWALHGHFYHPESGKPIAPSAYEYKKFVYDSLSDEQRALLRLGASGAFEPFLLAEQF